MQLPESNRDDSVQSVQTPEGIEFLLYPAGMLIRACAWLIDWFFQGILFIILIILALIFRWVFGIWFIFIMSFALNWFYHTAFEILCKGQSPGKRIMGIRVVRGDGSPVNPGASFLRNLMRFIDTLFNLSLIAFICMITSRSYRRIGDWTADTIVVYITKSSSRFASPYLKQLSMPWLEKIPPVNSAIKLSFQEKQAVLSFARRYPLLGKDRANEIADIWADKLGWDSTQSDSSSFMLGVARSLGV